MQTPLTRGRESTTTAGQAFPDFLFFFPLRGVVFGERGLRGDGSATDPCENLQLLPLRHVPFAKKEHGTLLVPPL